MADNQPLLKMFQDASIDAFKKFGTLDTGGTQTPAGRFSRLSSRPDSLMSILLGENEAINQVIANPSAMPIENLTSARDRLMDLMKSATDGTLDSGQEEVPNTFAGKWSDSLRRSMNPGSREREKAQRQLQSAQIIKEHIPTVIAIEKEIARREAPADVPGSNVAIEGIVKQALTEFQLSRREPMVQGFLAQGIPRAQAEFMTDKALGIEGFEEKKEISQKLAEWPRTRQAALDAGLYEAGGEQEVRHRNTHLGIKEDTGLDTVVDPREPLTPVEVSTKATKALEDGFSVDFIRGMFPPEEWPAGMDEQLATIKKTLKTSEEINFTSVRGTMEESANLLWRKAFIPADQTLGAGPTSRTTRKEFGEVTGGSETTDLTRMIPDPKFTLNHARVEALKRMRFDEESREQPRDRMLSWIDGSVNAFKTVLDLHSQEDDDKQIEDFIKRKLGLVEEAVGAGTGTEQN
jgi:hypothetical protein